MSLITKVERVSINKEGTEMYLVDNTGTYSPDNLSGWGSPNPNRGDMALLVEAYLNVMSGEKVLVPVYAYDPETATTFTLKLPSDGYIEILSIAVQKTAPTQDDTYGWTVEDGLQKMENGSLKGVTVLDVYNDGIVDMSSTKTVSLGKTIIYRNQMNLDLIALRRKYNNDKEHHFDLAQMIDNFTYVKALLEGANYLWCMGNYTGAEENVEVFNEFIKNISDSYE